MKTTMMGLAALVLLAGCSSAPTEPTATPEPMQAAPTAAAAPTTTAPETTEPVDLESPEPADPSVDPALVELPAWSAADGPVAWTCAAEAAQGVVYSYSLPTDMTHPLIVAAEGVRAALDGDEIHYVVVDVDATQATRERGSLLGMRWATDEQTTVEAVGAEDLIDEWYSDMADRPDLYNLGVEVSSTIMDAIPTRGAMGTALMATTEPITSMVAPLVMPDLMSPGFECYPDF